VPGANGIFVLSEIGGPLGERIRDVQRRFDPKLARDTPPHVTLVGSSGVGPIVPSTPAERIREALAPIAASTPVLELPVEPPHRFMQTNIVVLPLDPHGPLRGLHDRIARSGLTFARAKFTFTPHATLSFYPSLPREAFRELLAMRFDEPMRLDRMTVYYTRDPQPAVKLLELPFGGGPESAERRAQSAERL
jgi:2'-5' RNA ligase